MSLNSSEFSAANWHERNRFTGSMRRSRGSYVFLTLNFSVAFAPEAQRHEHKNTDASVLARWRVWDRLLTGVLPGLSSTWWEVWRTLPLEWTRIDQLTKNPEIIKWKQESFTRVWNMDAPRRGIPSRGAWIGDSSKRKRWHSAAKPSQALVQF